MKRLMSGLVMAAVLMFAMSVVAVPEADAAMIPIGVDIRYHGQTVCGWDDFSNFCGTFEAPESSVLEVGCENAAWGFIESWWHTFLAYALNILGMTVHFSC